ncbi:hypothetical protein AB836_00635 [Rickettsiales bacterium (ex Bugula neritina AB1)]|nr:hypothetical protein AB836_00635 [Rickettsiales bacterium (ex Bugula neritina AB1)]
MNSKNKARRSAGIRALRKSIKNKRENGLMKNKIRKIKNKIIGFVDKQKDITKKDIDMEFIKREFSNFNSLQDKMAKKKIFHPNKSQRNTSRLWKYINSNINNIKLNS